MALPVALLVAAVSPCAADTLIPRSEIMTADEIRSGMRGIGKSVFRGTAVESFGVTVLGVLKRLIRIDSGPPVARDYGIVAGMSGSPVYVNGKLIGALAYAWSFAKEPIAGVTPIAQMVASFRPGSGPARRRGTLRAAEPLLIDGQRIERVAVEPRPAASATHQPKVATLVPVATPVLVSGLDPGAMPLLRNALEPLGLVPLAGAGSMGDIETRIVPGQAIGARLVGGDLDITAIGTVTYVRDDVVLAFGHPLSSLGTTDLPLVAAYVHGVMPSSSLSFKLSSAGQSLGRFTEDRPWCVGGKLGERARLIETSVRVGDRDRGVVRVYGAEVVRSRSLTSTLVSTVVAGAVASIGPPPEGTTRVRFSIEAEGLPRLTRENIYARQDRGGLLSLLLGPAGAAASATQELSEILGVLQNSDFGEAPLERLEVAVEVSKDRRGAHLERVHIPQHRVRAGDEVEVIAHLRAADGSVMMHTETVRVPPNCPPGPVRVGIAGGRSADRMRSRLGIGYPTAQTMAQMLDQMLSRPSNHDLVIQLALPTVGIEARGFAFRDLPPAVVEVLRSAASTRLGTLRDYVEQRTRTEWAIAGDTVLRLTVEGDEKDKAGRPPSPRYQPPRYRRSESNLLDLFSGLDLAAPAASAMTDDTDDDEIDFDVPPPMPSWEEVESVGDREISVPSLSDGSEPGSGARGEAIGRVASVWRLSSQQDFLKGKSEGTTVLGEGGITLAPDPVVLDRVTTRCLWPIAVATDGSILTGSWGDGCLRRTTPDGETTVLLATEDAAIQAIAVGLDGTAYAAAAPSGTIYRVGLGEEPIAFCELDAQSVWSLVVSERGYVWAGTGPEGRLYRISPEGEVSLAFSVADRNITALALGPDGDIYMGTSPLGKIYAVSADGGARSIGEVEKAAVQSIAVDDERNVYVGTSPKARVLRIARDGTVSKLMEAKGKHVLSLLLRPDGLLYATVGPNARVHVIHPDQRSGVVYDPNTTFVAGMAADRSGNIYLTAADTGKIVKLDTVGARTGSYLTPVHDARADARWGTVRWQGHRPDGTGVGMWTRSGATFRPDDTWSPWQPVALDANAVVESPRNRFLQCRVDIETAGTKAPCVEAVEISYLTVNRAPEVQLASPKIGDVWSGRRTVRWSGRDPDGDRLTYRVYWSADRGQTWTSIESEGEDEAAGEEGGDSDSLSVAQEAARDEISEGRAEPRRVAGAVSLAHRLRGVRVSAPVLADEDPYADEESDGVPFELEEGMVDDDAEEETASGEGEIPPAESTVRASKATSRKWDTSNVPDGTYWMKVIGADARSNPADPREGEAISGAFVIDNTPPELIVDRRRQDEEAPPGEITAYETATYITSAEFRVDGGEWLAAVARDGIFDGRYEAIVLDEARLPHGSHAVEVRSRDAGGNQATVTLRYTR
jgi:sugar lactone lactonase YvrE